jgi:hypothetical protein
VADRYKERASMVKPSRDHARVAKPFTPKGLSGNRGWHGVPGAQHIPPVGDPALLPFIGVVREWQRAGIEMTEELMAAARKMAHAKLEEDRREAERIEAARQRETQVQAALDVLKPGSFGDASNGVVYYIRRGKYVKIGTTTNLKQRMRDLMPDEVLAVEPGSYKLESDLHYAFRGIRLSPDREYFELTEELQGHIDAVIEKHGPPPRGLSQFNPAA